MSVIMAALIRNNGFSSYVRSHFTKLNPM
jgi:hypothetical protein